MESGERGLRSEDGKKVSGSEITEGMEVRTWQFPGSERSAVGLEQGDSPGVGKWKGEFQARRVRGEAGGASKHSSREGSCRLWQSYALSQGQ